MDGTQPGGFSGYANIIVTDSLGIELQRKTYSGACGSGFYDLIQTRDKNFIAVGYNDQCDDMGGPGGTRRKKSFLIKINLANLTIPLWQQEFDVSSPYNAFTTINELSNGNLILSGALDTLNNYNIPEKAMLRVIKLDKNGNLIWKKYLSRDNAKKNSKVPNALNKCANGDFIIANFLPLVSSTRPYSITRIDSMGCDSTIGYCSTLGLQEINKNAKEIKLYPNPTSGVLNIELENLNAISTSSITNLNLKIINTLGQIVLEAKLEKTVNISSLKNGIYFLQLFDKGNLIGTEKIIKE